MEYKEKQFISGFNSGYLLADFEPRLLTILLKDLPTSNSYIAGILCGQIENEMMQNKIKMNEFEQLRNKLHDIPHKSRD